MNPFDPIRLNPDDPRLTAYALGELEGDEAAQVEAAIAADPALQAAVADIRATAGQLAAALEAEPLPAAPAPRAVYHTVRPARVFRLPYFALAGLAAAACLTLIIAVRVWPTREAEAKQQALALADQGAARKAAAPAAATAPAPAGSPIELQFGKEEAGKTPAPAGFTADRMEHLATVVPNPPPGEKVAADASMAPEIVGRSSSGGTPTGEVRVARQAEAKDETIQLSPFEVRAKAGEGHAAQPTLAGSRTKMTPALAMDANAPAAATYGRSTGGAASADTASADAFGASRSIPWAAPADWESPPPPAVARPAFNTEAYDFVGDNDFLAAAQNPLSTFAVDVDTASYSNVRRFLNAGQRPPRDAVRIEELVNYFTYHYAPPSGPAPFAASLEVAAAPWTPAHRLVRIGLKARELSAAARPAANLVFLIDVSGSMGAPNKLPLVKEALRLLVDQLQPEDRVAIVTYAGTSGLALPSTPARHRQELLDALDALRAGGRTNGAMGIQLAYDVARANFLPGGINRVILATDGDFNVGVTDRGDLVRLIEEKAKSGVFLTALGFGMGNYKDATLEQLADHGNGTYAYVDSTREARRVLVEQVNGTLATVARDVKVQVEFNPAKVQAYRLIGYEDRLLQKEDFNNDRIDAGDVGAGHTVTALYEVIPVGVEWKPAGTVDALKYQAPVAGSQKPEASETSDQLLTVKIRYQAPEGGASRLLEFPLADRGTAFADASADFKFAAAVAGFGMVLRDSAHKGTETLADVARWAAAGIDSDAGGDRTEFVSLVKRAGEILPTQG